MSRSCSLRAIGGRRIISVTCRCVARCHDHHRPGRQPGVRSDRVVRQARDAAGHDAGDASDRLHAWQDQQDATRKAIQIGSWYAATLQPGETVQDLVTAWQSLAAAALGNAASRWVACQRDAAGNAILTGPPPDVLCTTITSDLPTRR